MSVMRSCRIALFSVVVGCVGLSGQPSHAAGVADARSLYRQTVSGVVWIVTSEGCGTGWIIDHERRLIVTNNHVIDGETEPNVVFPEMENSRLISGREHYVKRKIYKVGRVVVCDKRRDLAIIQVPELPASASALRLGVQAEPGQRVHSVGNPGSSSALWVYSNGTVRQAYQAPLTWPKYQGVEIVETQVPINPGDSGSPVVDDDGKVVGVSSSVCTNASLVTINIDVNEIRHVYVQAVITLGTAKASENPDSPNPPVARR